ncbi:MAG: ComF family protein [Bryobacterales bacterium]|nr:ComF family protein [Bryobacterales bacterium]
MAVKIDPKTLRGPWASGFALDVHTTGSTFLGHNEYGHPVFETGRSPIGNLVYRLKYRGDRSALAEITETASDFLSRTWKLEADVIVPVPPSNTSRRNQPVIVVATGLSELCGIPVCESCIKKVKSTAPLKDVFDLAKRTEILQSAFAVDASKTAGKTILLFDDLFRSGATAGTISRLLSSEGGAKAVYLLTLTRTRSSL